MPSLVDNDGSMQVPDPHEWQLFAPPPSPHRPRIRIPLPNYPECGKFVNDDNEDDNDDDEDDDSYPRHGNQENTPVTSPIRRKTAPKVKPLQAVDTNLRRSYIRKVKGIKRSVIDLQSDDGDWDQDIEEEAKWSNNPRKTTIAKTTTKTPTIAKPKPKAKTAKATIQKKKSTQPSKLVHDNPPLPPPPPPLPNGSYESWEFYVDNGGYKLTTEERISVKSFVKIKRSNPVAVAEGIKFHRLVKGMRAQLSNSPRDAWDLVLPAKSHSNFEFCCLFLMIATPAVTDDSIIQVFGPLFLENNVTPAWVLQEGEDGIANRLRALGRQTMTARYIVAAARNWSGMPRDYRGLSNYLGVGPKISLVCIAVCFGDDQGAPCDVHMVRIFKALGWMSVDLDVDESLVKMETEKERKGKTDNEYEVARASIEGWFPKVAWGELNQTWAGLGQLLNKKDARKQIAEYVDSESKSWTSDWRAADRKAISLLLKAY
jgi:endonuclease III